eukprot:6160870-Pyramimonas_sp.AAC.1
MSNSFQNLHHRREDAAIVVGLIFIGARTGRACVGANIVTSISTIIMLPPKSPTRSAAPAEKCPAVGATAAAS